MMTAQPPSGGCVLKLLEASEQSRVECQPPSGGCVLKPTEDKPAYSGKYPAAFGRLCVETHSLLSFIDWLIAQPPSGGCVLKQ